MWIDKSNDLISRLRYKTFSYEIVWILIMGDFYVLLLADLGTDSYFLSTESLQKKFD